MVMTAVILSSGCGLMKEQRQLAISEVYADLNSATQVPALVKLEKGDSLQILISEDSSPRIQREGYTDYFEVVDLEGIENQRFYLELHAMCDCLGFRKWAVLSEAFLINPSGELVDLNPTGLQSRLTSGVFKESGSHKLFIIAASKYKGKKMGVVRGYYDGTNTISEMSVPLIVHPTGTIKLEYK